MRALDWEGSLGQVAAEHGGGLVEDFKGLSDDVWSCGQEAKQSAFVGNMFTCILCGTPMSKIRPDQVEFLLMQTLCRVIHIPMVTDQCMIVSP